MKKRLGIALACAFAFALCATLASCGGGSGTDEKAAKGETDSKATEEAQASAYEGTTFTLGDYWEITTTNDEVLFDEDAQCDNLVIHATATNKDSEKRAFANMANINAYQNEKSLDSCQIKDGDAFLCSKKIWDEEVEPNGSIDIVIGWQLEDSSKVTVNFGGYTVAVEDTDLFFDVASRKTAELTAAEEAAAKELAEKKNTKEITADSFTIKVADGWVADDFSKTSAKLILEGTDGYLTVDSSTSWGTAQDWASKLNSNYGGDKIVDTVEANGITWTRLNASDTQFHLFANCADGKTAVHVNAMFYTYDQALPQIAGIAVS